MREEVGWEEEEDALQMPDSRPTAKQLASLLKETERTTVGFDVSIGGRTFMAAGRRDQAPRGGRASWSRLSGSRTRWKSAGERRVGGQRPVLEAVGIAKPRPGTGGRGELERKADGCGGGDALGAVDRIPLVRLTLQSRPVGLKRALNGGPAVEYSPPSLSKGWHLGSHRALSQQKLVLAGRASRGDAGSSQEWRAKKDQAGPAARPAARPAGGSATKLSGWGAARGVAGSAELACGGTARRRSADDAHPRAVPTPLPLGPGIAERRLIGAKGGLAGPGLGRAKSSASCVAAPRGRRSCIRILPRGRLAMAAKSAKSPVARPLEGH